jgi:hypothetical protein
MNLPNSPLAGKAMLFTLSFCLFFTFKVSCQSSSTWRKHIDFIVEQIDSLSMKSQTTFYLTKVLRNDRSFKNDDTYKETWHYTLNDDKVIVFEVRYLIKSSEFTEVYYLDRGRPVCIEYYETPYLASYIDEVRHGEMYFLYNNAVKQFVSFGNKKIDNGMQDAQTLALTRFEKRYSELQKYLK